MNISLFKAAPTMLAAQIEYNDPSEETTPPERYCDPTACYIGPRKSQSTTPAHVAQAVQKAELEARYPGVTFIGNNFSIGADVVIEPGAVLDSTVDGKVSANNRIVLQGKTHIGKGTRLSGNIKVVSSQINNALVSGDAVIQSSTVEAKATIMGNQILIEESRIAGKISGDNIFVDSATILPDGYVMGFQIEICEGVVVNNIITGANRMITK